MTTMKVTMKWMLMAVLTCSLGMGVAACSSDDNDEKEDNRVVTDGDKVFVPDSLLTDEERRQMACGNAAGSILRNLIGSDELNFKDVPGKTYEPTYGITLEGEGSTVRAVKCYSKECADAMFRALTGVDEDDAHLVLTPTLDGYELSLRDLPILEDGNTFTLGTLTFHRDGGPRRYGWVDVEISCIPHLERIDFLSPEAFPDNANTPYMPGDVIYVNHNESGYCGGYYLCVATTGNICTLIHLCVGEPGGDETVNFDGDKEGCWVPYNAKQKGDMTRFEDVLEYVDFLANKKAQVASIKAFMNGEADRLPYQEGKLYHIMPEGFNNNEGVVYVNTWGDKDGCNVFYDAKWGRYHAGYAYYHRHPIRAHIPHNCKSIKEVTSHTDDYVLDRDFKTGHQYYTMNTIHTYKEIEGSFIEMSATKTVAYGVEAIYATTKQLGWCFADDGVLYDSPEKAKSLGHNPLGFLAFLNTGKGEWMDYVTEKGANYGHGLVMSYNWANDGKAISLAPESEPLFTEDNWYDTYINNSMKSVREDFDGLARTLSLSDVSFPAAKAAINMQSAKKPMNCSDWFIPSTGQWLAILCNDRQGGKAGLGDAEWPSESYGYSKVIMSDPFKNLINMSGNDGYLTTIMTSSAKNSKQLVYMIVSSGSYFQFTENKRKENVLVRPVFAF